MICVKSDPAIGYILLGLAFVQEVFDKRDVGSGQPSSLEDLVKTISEIFRTVPVVKNVILHILNKDPAIYKCSGQSLLILYGGICGSNIGKGAY
jgi:hypothetical protein